MDTKRLNNSASQKGGRNPFGKLSIMAGSLVAGAATMEAIEKWRREHHNASNEAQDGVVTPQVDEQEKPQTEEKLTQGNAEEINPQETGHVSNEPHAVDPENPNQAVTENHPSSTEPTPDEIAQRIAESDEIDPVDDNFVALMNVGEHRTVYTENGEVDAFAVEFNDPGLAGYPFVLADSDGDGYYDTVLMADGTPANIYVDQSDSTSYPLDSYLAQIGISQSDLEEMSQSDGGYLSPGNITQNDDPSEDIIDTVNPHTITQDSDDDDIDEAILAALLANLLTDDENEDATDDEKDVNELLALLDEDDENDVNELLALLDEDDDTDDDDNDSDDDNVSDDEEDGDSDDDLDEDFDISDDPSDEV